jgi:cytochrome c biogenesis protein CcdA
VDVTTVAFALLAGAVATVNPCGFALLPAYLGLLVAGEGADGGGAAAVGRALRFSTGMTVGFVAVFGAFAAVVTPLALALERYLPVLTVVVGLLLVAVGAWLLSGREIKGPALPGRSGRAPTATWASQVGYGVTFALASLSCTVAPFLAVTSGALRTGGPAGVATTFLAYALGMGTVVLVLAVTTALARGAVTRALRRSGGLVVRASGLLLVVAGAYLAWYGWFEIRVFSGSTTTDPVVSAATGLQGRLTRLVESPGAGGWAAVALVLAGAGLAWRVATRSPRQRTRT